MLDRLADWRKDDPSSHKRTMITTTCPMIDSLTADNGRLTWEDACRVAAAHNLYEDFLEDWWTKCCYNYDAGVSADDLAHWLGY